MYEDCENCNITSLTTWELVPETDPVTGDPITDPLTGLTVTVNTAVI